jgi:hypothetical protein
MLTNRANFRRKFDTLAGQKSIKMGDLQTSGLLLSYEIESDATHSPTRTYSVADATIMALEYAVRRFALEFRATENEDNSKHFALMGPINEDSEMSLKGILGELNGVSKATFNFAKVTTINSLGVRAWVQFLRAAEEGRNISFEECTPDVIAQINMIPSFSSKSKILSFYTNYICDSCNKTESILIQTANLKPKAMPEKAKCQTCQAEMETEELEDEYFAFIMK